MAELLEFLVLILFVMLITVVFAFCAEIMGRGFRKGWKLRRIDNLILLVGLIGVMCIGYGFTEPYQLETTKFSIDSKKLSKGSRMRFALISDLHCDGVARAEKKLVTELAKQKPDLILFAGDAADSEEGVLQFKSLMAELSQVAPVYAVDGNHDTWSSVSPEQRYEGTQCHLLNCSAAVEKIGNNLVWLGGVAIGNEGCTEKVLSTSPPDSFTVFLYHFPEGITNASAHNIDLFCTGHTHGGQIRLPWYGAIVTMAASGKKYEWGNYKKGSTSMYVNRGIGMTGLPVRFLCPPELTIIDVEGAK